MIHLETVSTSKTRYIHGYKKEVYWNVHISSNRLTPIFKVYRNSQFQGVPRIWYTLILYLLQKQSIFMVTERRYIEMLIYLHIVWHPFVRYIVSCSFKVYRGYDIPWNCIYFKNKVYSWLQKGGILRFSYTFKLSDT